MNNFIFYFLLGFVGLFGRVDGFEFRSPTKRMIEHETWEKICSGPFLLGREQNGRYLSSI